MSEPRDPEKSLLALEAWLKFTFPSEVLMPCTFGAKYPAFRHAGNGWTWQRASAAIESFGRSEVVEGGVGILLQRLCVVDVDSEGLASALEGRFPILKSVPAARTARGVHYFFARSKKCDAEGFFDGAAQKVAGVDFKTVCSTGTSGFVVCPPSRGKAWERAPWDATHPIVEIPDEVLTTVASPTRKAGSGVSVRLRGSTYEIGPRLASKPYLSLFRNTLCGEDLEPIVPDRFDPRALVALNAHGLAVPDIVSNGLGGLEDVRALVSEMAALADFLGCAPKEIERLRRIGREVAENAEIHPELANTIVSFEMVDVPVRWSARAAGDRTDAAFRNARVFADEVRNPPNRSKHCIVPYPATAVLNGLPRGLLAIMKKWGAKVMVAGGFVLSRVINDAPVPTSDIDVYVVGAKVHEAYEILNEVACLAPSISVTSSAVTIHPRNGGVPIQVVLMLADSAEQVLDNFDMEPCRVGAFVSGGAMRVVSSRAWGASIVTRSFPLVSKRWSRTSTFRALKLAHKGFQPYVAGLDRSRVAKRMENVRSARDLRSAIDSVRFMKGAGAIELLAAEEALTNKSTPVEKALLVAYLRSLGNAGYLATGCSLDEDEAVANEGSQPRKIRRVVKRADVVWRVPPKFSERYAFAPENMRLEEVVRSVEI
jgi:hypothetical protein